MWLIDTTSLVLKFVEDSEVVIYAILSHTWGDGEVSFQDMADLERARKKQGFSKIERTCQLARERDIEYAWVGKLCSPCFCFVSVAGCPYRITGGASSASLAFRTSPNHSLTKHLLM